ncbi:hypothetical protein [Mucilaginibacter panaciglaebae]|uniref:hypothetical protein n=1 Tax=Mucilaginibacter panaciglaebae TaxID=502331 RepID=UPI0031EE2918
MATINLVAYGQIKYGTVTNNAGPVSGAVIENLNSGRISMSGGTGDFIMKLKKGDTILTSYSNFKTDTIVYNNQNPLLIKLKPLTNLLDEVTISERQLSPIDKLLKNQDDYRQIYRIGDDRGFFVILPGLPIAGIAINIDALYSHFSKAGKNARKLQKTLIRDYQDDMIDMRFTKALVTKYTGYAGKQLESFMIDNRPAYEFMKYASNYDLIVYIKQKLSKNPATKDVTFVAQNKP